MTSIAVNDGTGIPELSAYWAIGDIDYIAFSWDEAIGQASITDSEFILNDEWAVRQEFGVTDVEANGTTYSNTYVILIESLGASDQCSSTKSSSLITHRVSLSDGRRLTRSVRVYLTGN